MFGRPFPRASFITAYTVTFSIVTVLSLCMMGRTISTRIINAHRAAEYCVGSFAAELTASTTAEMVASGERALDDKTGRIAADVAAYLERHPRRMLNDLEADEAFAHLATQDVGEVGCTFAFELGGGPIVMPSRPPARTPGSRREVLSASSIEGIVAAAWVTDRVCGYHRTVQLGSRAEPWYIAMAPVPTATADGRHIVIACAVPSSTIAERAAGIEGALTAMRRETGQHLAAASRSAGRSVLVSSAVAIGAVAFMLGLCTWLVVRNHRLLEASEHRYRMLSEHALVGMFVYRAGTLQLVNRRFAEMLGYEPDELVGRPLLDLVHPDERDTLSEIITLRESDAEAPERYETRFITADGQERWGDVWSRRVEDVVSGGVMVNVLDITESKLAQTALGDSENRYRSLFESNMHAIVLTDPDTGRIVDANTAATALTGYTREELLGMRRAQLHPADQAVHSSEDRADTGQMESEGEILRADGARIPVQISATMTTFSGRDVVLGMFVDLTERRKADEQMRRRLAVEEAVATVSRLFVTATDVDIVEGLAVIGKAFYAASVAVVTFEAGPERAAATHTWQAPRSRIVLPEDSDREDVEINPWLERLGLGYNIVIPDASADEVPDAQASLLREHAIRAAMIVPVVTAGAQPVGFIAVVDTDARADWTDQDAQALRLVAEIISSHWDRNRAETARRDSEAVLRGITTSSPDMIIVMDEDGRYLEVFSQTPVALGQPLEALRGKLLHELLPVELADRFLDTVRKTIETGQRHTIEYQLHVHDGGRWFEARTALMSERPNGKAAIIWNARDISARKRVEQALQQAYERVETILSTSMDGFLTVQSDGRISECNKAFCEMLGYTRDEIIGMHTSDFLATRAVDDPIRNLPSTVKRGDARFETAYRAKDESVVNLEVSASYVELHNESLFVLFVRDITERKRAEEAIRTSEERLELALKGAGTGMWDWDMLTGQRTVHRRVWRILGYGADELNPDMETWLALTHPDDVEVVQAAFDEHIEGRTDSYVAEYRVRSKQGEYKWLLDTGMVVEWDVNGHPVRAAGTLQDISERIESQRALAESEQKYRSVVDSICVGVVMLDPGLRIMAVNRQMREWFDGVKVGSKNPCYKVLTNTPREKACHDCPTRLTLKDGQVHEGTERLILDGQGVILRRVSSPVLDADGSVIAAVETFEDITERVRAEEAIRESEARYRTLFDSATDAIFVHDEEGRMLDCNSVACERLGYSREELLKLGPHDLDAPEYTGGVVAERVAELRETGETTYETAHVTRDGRLIATEVSARIIEYSGTPAVISVARDITERKEAERQLMLSERKFRAFTEQSLTPIWVVQDGRIVYCNAALAVYIGVADTAQAHNARIRDIVAADDRTELEGKLNALLLGEVEAARMVIRFSPAPGQVRWHDAQFARIEYEGRAAVLAASQDITEIKLLMEQLDAERLRDSLTGLYNRRYFNEVIAHEASQSDRYGGELTLLTLDIDGFKGVNDTFGHNVGDHVLQTFSDVLRNSVRGADIPIRFGGDEFLVVMPSTDAAGAELVAPRLAQTLVRELQKQAEQEMLPPDIDKYVWISGGAASYSAGSGETLDDVLRVADERMYKQKEANRKWRKPLGTREMMEQRRKTG